MMSYTYSTQEEHTKVLKRCFEKAEKELLIFSPFLSYSAINSDNLIPLIDETIVRGVRIIVVTDGSSIQASTLDLRNKVERYQKDNLAKTS